MIPSFGGKVTAAALAALLAFQACGLPSARAGGGSPVPIIIHSAIDEGKTDSARTMYYTDDYFASSAFTYNPSLATASLCLAMAAFGSNKIFQDPDPLRQNYEKAPDNFKELMQNLGCDSVDVRMNPMDTDPSLPGYYESMPDTEHVAFGIGKKTVSDGKGEATLLVVGVRGANYQSEWASNVNVGSSGDHAGFRSAALQVIGGLKSYVQKYNVQGRVKLWISGFSRAAATSNLVAGYLDKWIDAPSAFPECGIGAALAKEDLYAYTFETPSGTVDSGCASAAYGNIFNFVNPNDLVPKVAPYLGGQDDFRRYGVDRFFPSSISDAGNDARQTAMLDCFKPLLEERKIAYTIDQFRIKRFDIGARQFRDADIGQHSAAAFANDFLNDLVQNGIHTRSEYVAKYQQPLMTVMGFLCGCAKYGTPSQVQAFQDYLKSPWHFAGPAVLAILAVLNPLRSVQQTIARIASLLRGLLASARDASGVKIPDEELDKVQQAIEATLSGLVNEVGKLEIVSTVDLVMTLWYNVDRVLQAHDPDLCYAWLMTMDPNYRAQPLDAGQVFHCGEYRVLMVWGKAKVTVQKLSPGAAASITLDENGALTGDAALMDELFGIRPTPTLHNLTYYYLPTNGHYRVQITNLDNNNYSVSEYSPAVGDVKRLFTYTRLVPKGDYIADFPAYTPSEQQTGLPEGSSYSYALQKGTVYQPGGQTIALPCQDLRLSDLRSNYATLRAVTSNGLLGSVAGGGTFRRYTVTLLQAAETEYGDFLGWRMEGDTVLLPQRELAVPVYLSKQTYTACFGYVGMPQSLTAVQEETVTGAPMVTVSWKAPVKGDAAWVQGYRIYRKPSTDSAYALVAQTDQSTLSWQDAAALTPGMTYDYAVVTLAKNPEDAASALVESRKALASVTLGNPWRLAANGVTVCGYSLGEAPSGLSAQSCAQSDSRNGHMTLLTGEAFIGSYALSLDGNTAHIQNGLTVTLPAPGLPDGTALRLQQDRDPSGSGEGESYVLAAAGGAVTLQTQSAALGQFFLTTLQKPGAPAQAKAYNSAAVAGEYQVTVTWERPAQPCLVDAYVLYRSDRASPLAVLDENTCAYVDDAAVQGAAYTYQIFARNQAGDGPAASAAVQVGNYWSLSAVDALDGQTVTVSGYSEGAAPTGLSVTACQQEDVKNSGFHLFNGEDYLGSWAIALTGNLQNVKDGYNVTLPAAGVKQGQAVRLQQQRESALPVEHANGSAAGGYTVFRTPSMGLGQFFITALGEASAPTSLTAAVASVVLAEPPCFRLSWQAPREKIDAVNGYVIYRDGTPIGRTAATVLTFTDRDPALTSATVYTYSVTADNGSIEGAAAQCAVSSLRQWVLKQNGVTVSGFSDRDAPSGIMAQSLRPGDLLLRHMPEPLEEVVSRYELGYSSLRPVSILEGTQLTVSLPVPVALNGKQTTVQHDRDSYGSGDVESLSATAEDGQSTVAVDSLSPFQVSGHMEKPPQTGDPAPLGAWLAAGGAALAALLWLLWSRRRR